MSRKLLSVYFLHFSLFHISKRKKLFRKHLKIEAKIFLKLALSSGFMPLRFAAGNAKLPTHLKAVAALVMHGVMGGGSHLPSGDPNASLPRLFHKKKRRGQDGAGAQSVTINATGFGFNL